MQRRETDVGVEPLYGDLVLRTPPNWTAVAFLAMLGGLHLAIAIPSLLVGRWAGYMSLCLGSLILVLSAACLRFRSEIAVLPSQRRVRLRTGVGPFRYERFVPFGLIRGVRLTLEAPAPRHAESVIELLSRGEDILCPPTSIPRQQALFLAMAMNVPLIKVSDDAELIAPDRVDELSTRRA